MLRWAFVFLIFALVAGLLGFTGIAGQSMSFARILFFAFLVILLAGLMYSVIAGRRSKGGVDLPRFTPPTRRAADRADANGGRGSFA